MISVGFVGAGAVGSTLARALANADVNVVAVWARSPDRARRLADELPGCTAYAEAQSVVEHAELVFLTVPDDAIRDVCNGLAWSADKSVVHCSGAHTVDVLASAVASGARAGACHPMQAFPGTDLPPDHLSGCMFGVEADEPLRSVIDGLVSRIGGWSLHLSSEDKASYHLAGVIASNYLVTLAASAVSLLEKLGVEPDDALAGLLPILRGTVSNLETTGLPMALTGPISRGDNGTNRLHLETLAARHPELLSLYVELGLRTIPIALARGGLTQPDAAELEDLFDRFSHGE